MPINKDKYPKVYNTYNLTEYLLYICINNTQ